jgi:diacylglycerol kinase family enzyme
VKVNQQEQTLRTPMIFIGRNECQLREFALPGSDCVKNDGLVVYILPPVTRLGLLRLAIRLLHRGPELQKEVSYFCATSLEIDSRQKMTTVAIDGERVKLQYPLRFGVASKTLSIISPVREPQVSPENAA